LRASGLVKAFGRRPAGGGHSRSVSVQPPTADLQINEGNQLNGLMRKRPAPHDKWRARNSCTFKFDWTGFSGRPQLSTSKPGDGLREGRKALPRIAWQVAKSIAPSASSSKSMTPCRSPSAPASPISPASIRRRPTRFDQHEHRECEDAPPSARHPVKGMRAACHGAILHNNERDPDYTRPVLSGRSSD
jgi:hypothetical protein